MAQSIVGQENVQPYKFSECSKKDYIDALRTGHGLCLLNKPNEVRDAAKPPPYPITPFSFGFGWRTLCNLLATARPSPNKSIEGATKAKEQAPKRDLFGLATAENFAGILFVPVVRMNDLRIPRKAEAPF